MDLTGRKLGKYEIIELIGQGGMAEVYKAHQPGLDRFVAIKVMHRHLARSEDFVTRFKREAKSIGQLQHPNIMHVNDFDIENDDYYLVMDYIQGETLADYLNRTGPLPLAEALTLIAQLVDAVDYAHQQGMIHRDIKPANVMFRDAAHSQVILTDFGMARLLNETGLTVSGALVGTPAYMSPEAVHGGENIDERSDIYSLGLILYEMVTGTPPYTGDSALAVIMKQANDPLPPPRQARPDLPQSIEALLYKALAKEPAERFQSAAAFKEANAQAQASLANRTVRTTSDTMKTVVSAPSSAGREPAAAKSNRWPLLAIAGGGTLLVILLIVIASMFGRLTGEPEPGPELAAAPPAGQAAPAGFLRFADNETARAGDFILQMDEVAPPPANSRYTLWLTDDNDEDILNLVNQLPVNNGRVNIEGSTDQSLPAAYSRAVITLESGQAPAETISGEIVYAGGLPPAFLEPVRRIIFEAPEPEKGLLPGAEEQLRLAMDHAGFLQDGLANDDFEEAHRHAEHVVNILVGEEGPEFSDLDQNGRVENPGDGFGLHRYLEDTLEQTRQAAENPTSNPQPQLVDRILETGANNLTLVEEATDTALKIFAADTIDEAQNSADDLELSLNQILNGADLDDNGAIDPTANEGGLLSLYEDSLLLSEIAIFPGQ